MTDLTLSNVGFSASDFKQVGRLVNLQNLHFRNGRAAIVNSLDDNVLQAWNRHAKDTGSFRHLELISIVNAPGITVQAFEYLNTFPVLDTIILCHTSVRTHHKVISEKHGWLRQSE